MTHPYSIYIWQPPLSPRDEGLWIGLVQVYTQQYAIYLADLIHKDTRSVIKVIRYGITIASFPDEVTVERVERFIEKQNQTMLSDQYFPVEYAHASWHRLQVFFQLPGRISRRSERVEVELKRFNDHALNRDLETLYAKVAQEQPR